MNNNHNFENLKAERALRRERKKRRRIHQHGRSLKRVSRRSVLHIHKLTKKK